MKLIVSVMELRYLLGVRNDNPEHDQMMLQIEIVGSDDCTSVTVEYPGDG